MKPIFQTHQGSPRQRQIGRKVLQADRLSHAVERTGTGSTSSLNLQWLGRFRRVQTLVPVVIVVLVMSALGFSGIQWYSAQAAASQKEAATKQQRIDKENSEAADACRRDKAAKKADQIGKVTFDELYDYDECDK